MAPVDYREVRARMDLPMTRLLLDRGYDKDIIRSLIEERLRERRDFESAVELLLAYMESTKARAPDRSQLSGFGSPHETDAFIDVRQKAGVRLS